MWRFASLILLSATLVSFTSAQAPLSTICPGMTDNTIDGSFKGCRSPEVALTGPRDSKQYTFEYGYDQDVSVTFTIRAVIGSVVATFSTANTPVMVNTYDGAGILRLTPTEDLDNEWTLKVESMLGLPSKFVIEVAISNMTTVASEDTRSVLSSMYEECCDSTPDSSNPFINGRPVPTPCRLLAQWTTAVNASDDVCQSDYAHCTPQGVLDMLVMRSFVITSDSGNYEIPPAFTPRCTAEPPTYLGNLTELTHLELFAMGLQWKVPDLVNAVGTMSKLERLYLGYNQISGELNAEACPLFQDTPLKSLSFRNPMDLDVTGQDPSPPWNAISGELHICVFNSSLENLNLVMNRISGIPSIPDANSIKGQLKNLRLYSQMDPSNNYEATMAGSGIPKGLENLQNLEFLGLAGNELGGSLDGVIVPPTLEWLDLSGNALTGQIPDLTRQFKRLTTLIISDNPGLKQDITKTGIEGLTDLLYLDISNTSMTGVINNVDWSKLSNLKVLDASATDMEGEVPASLAKLPYLQEVVLSRNPKITSQTNFANALSPDNNITIYDMHSSGLVDLPDTLQNLRFFKADFVNIYKANAWVFDISNNDIEAPIPTWLVAPLREPVNLFQALATTRDTYGNTAPQYLFAIQINGDEKDGNRLGCPNEPVPKEDLQYAVELQYIFKGYYNGLVNCYNGTEMVPVASYVAWLATNGPLPAPPPYTASRNKIVLSQFKNGNEGKKSGPSGGALAGIVVGVLVGVAALAALAFVIVKVVVPKMKNKRFEKFQDSDPQGMQTGPYGSPDQFQMAVQVPAHQPGPNAV